jgi:hypothetical protein
MPKTKPIRKRDAEPEPKEYRPEEYIYIYAWHKSFGSQSFYCRRLQEQAAEERAPIDAIFKRYSDGSWVRLIECTPPTKARIEQYVKDHKLKGTS